MMTRASTSANTVRILAALFTLALVGFWVARSDATTQATPHTQQTAATYVNVASWIASKYAATRAEKPNSTPDAVICWDESGSCQKSLTAALLSIGHSEIVVAPTDTCRTTTDFFGATQQSVYGFLVLPPGHTHALFVLSMLAIRDHFIDTSTGAEVWQYTGGAA